MGKNRFAYLYFSVALLLWAYLMCRAWLVPPVHDEAATFFHYINHGEFLPGHALWDANNHILNSFLGKYFVKVFGISAFSIRMASLMFFPMYAWFLYQFSRELQTRRMKYLLLLTGFGIHGFIEYFAYSRGYGMSMGILIAALYYSYQFIAKKNIHLLLVAIGFYWLATLSNLTLQNTALMFFAVASLYIFSTEFTGKQKIVGGIYITLGVLSILPFVKLSLNMKRDGLLYYAQDENFWTAVITSFTQMFFDSKNILLKFFWFVWAGVFLWLSADFIFKLKKHWQINKSRMLFPLLFFGNLFSIFSMHYLLGVNFPSDRTGMHLILYLFLGGIFLADLSKNMQQIAVAIPTLFFVLQFAVGANLSHSTYWKGEHLPERFWTKIHEESVNQNNSNPTVGGYRIRNLVWAWYNFKHGGQLQNMQYFNYYTGFEDYQLFSNPDFDRTLYDSLDFDESSGVTLARRKHFLDCKLWMDSTGYVSTENFNGEYFNLFETLQPDSFIGHSWLVEADIKLYSLATPPKINLVTSFTDNDGKQLDYQTSPLHWLKKEYRPEDDKITVKIWWYSVPENTKRIVVYLWNEGLDAYTLQNSSLRIYRVVDEIPHPDTAPSLIH